MTAKVRKQIYLDQSQSERLKQLASSSGVSEAEVIRQALDQYAHALPPRQDLKAWHSEAAFIERLIAQGSVSGGRTWKREDLYER